MLTPALLTALVAAIKQRAAGAAADHLVKACESAATKLQGLLPDDEKRKAEALLAHVLAESAAFPPRRALRVEPLAHVGAGIWPPRGKLTLKLLWINRADFPVLIRDVVVTARIGLRGSVWELRQGDEFGLAPRSDQERTIEGEPSSELPTFDRGGASCDVTMSALVAGPWLDGHAQTTRDLVRSTLWLPVYLESEPVSLLTNPSDIDIALAGDLESLEATSAAAATVRYAEHDRKLGLRPGATKERLPHVAAKRRHKIEIGETLARVRLEYGPTYLGGGSDLDDDFSL